MLPVHICNNLEQDRTAGAHGGASCQLNGSPGTEHISVKRLPNLGNSSKCVHVNLVTLFGRTSPT